MVIDSALDYTFNGPGSISGSGTVTKNNINVLTLAAANSYTGGTVVNGGTLVLTNAAGAGTGTITLE